MNPTINQPVFHGRIKGFWTLLNSLLVGGEWLPWIWNFPINIGLRLSSQLTFIFFRGVAQTPTRLNQLLVDLQPRHCTNCFKLLGLSYGKICRNPKSFWSLKKAFRSTLAPEIRTEIRAFLWNVPQSHSLYVDISVVWIYYLSFSICCIHTYIYIHIYIHTYIYIYKHIYIY